MLGGTEVCTSLVISSDIAEVLAESLKVINVKEELVLLSKEVVI
jgi:hypothetical protein